jgi:hypothetical protein
MSNQEPTAPVEADASGAVGDWFTDQGEPIATETFDPDASEDDDDD